MAPDISANPVEGSIPKIGSLAPDFTAVTTQGQITFSEWKGNSWAVLFSHPADFTPVCSTELAGFAGLEPEFTRRNVKLIAVSVDSIHAHLAWREDLQKMFSCRINYPMVADNTMAVSQKFGMIHPGHSTTAPVRAVFVIDPKGVIQAIIYYPMNVGRNLNEILRLIDALQVSARHAVETPVNWKSGEKVIMRPPKTAKEVEKRKKSSAQKLAFYLCKKDAD
ncbi:MAG: peroxiredoxin [Candidatus Micrarchaeota archaeon]